MGTLMLSVLYIWSAQRQLSKKIFYHYRTHFPRSCSINIDLYQHLGKEGYLMFVKNMQKRSPDYPSKDPQTRCYFSEKFNPDYMSAEDIFFDSDIVASWKFTTLHEEIKRALS